MDYNKEKESLIETTERNWWKPTAGQHSILFVSEAEEFDIEWEGETIHKVAFKISVDNKEYDWSMTKGRTQNSLWGQITLVGANLGNLKGREITLVVKGEGKNTSYTVMEALPLMKPKEETVN